VIQTAAVSRLGTREERRLSRHVTHCQACRREAIAAGLDESILTHVPLPKRAARKIAGLLPFPLFGRNRGGDGPGWASNLPMLSDQMAGGWGKLATAAAVVVAGVGASGVGTHMAGSQDDRDRPAVQERAATAPQKAAVAKAKPGSAPAAGTERRRAESRRSDRAQASGGRRDPGTRAGAPAANSGGGGQSGSDAGGSPANAGLPAATGEATRPVRETVENAGRTLQPVTDTVQRTVGGATQPVQDTVGDVTDTVGGATQPVQGAVGGATETVGGATQPVQGAVGGATQPVQGAVGGVVDDVEDTTGTDLPLP
jgi:hypothetical protein